VTILRTNAGLLFRDDFNRTPSDVVGNGWTEVGPFAIANLEGNGILDAPVAGESQLYRALNHGASFILQANVWEVDGFGVFCRSVVGTDGYLLVFEPFPFPVPDRVAFYRDGVLENVFLSFGPPGVRRLRLVGDVGGDLSLQAYGLLLSEVLSGAALGDLSGDFGDSILGYLDGAPRIGTRLGVRALTTGGKADEWFVCGRNVVVSGLPVGWKAQIDARSAVVETDGVVTFNVDAWALPAGTLKVLDGGDVLRDQVAPAGGVWGGDTYLCPDWYAVARPAGSWAGVARPAGSWVAA